MGDCSGNKGGLLMGMQSQQNLIFKIRCVHVRLFVQRSQRALTLYTQRQTALLRPIYPVSAVVGS